jgi:hypothetical protein
MRTGSDGLSLSRAHASERSRLIFFSECFSLQFNDTDCCRSVSILLPFSEERMKFLHLYPIVLALIAIVS